MIVCGPSETKGSINRMQNRWGLEDDAGVPRQGSEMKFEGLISCMGRMRNSEA